MNIIDRDFVKAINSGNCFVIVGAGPSTEIGLPSWSSLAKNILNDYKSNLGPNEIKICEELIRENKLPSLFELMLNNIGISEMDRFIKNYCKVSYKEGKIYSYLVKWPFAVYLTTNYDDLIELHAKNKDLILQSLKNTEEEFRLINSSSKNIICKIHGDYTNFDNIVLTETQYNEFQYSPKREYWRNKLLSVLNMVDIVIIGYSAKDPDFLEQLERSKKIASYEKPIFMIASDFSETEINDYLLKYNIRILSYQNNSGKHTELQKLLNRYDPFIAKRGTTNVGLKPIKETEVSVAAAMYIFTQTRLNNDEIYIIKIYAILIIQLLTKNAINEISKHDLVILLEDSKLITNKIDPVALDRTLKYLYNINFISFNTEDFIKIEENAKEVSQEILEKRKTILEMFQKSCEAFLIKNYKNLNELNYAKIFDFMRRGLIRAFEQRGMEIARSIFGGSDVDFSDATDLLEILNESSQGLQTEEKIAYVDLMIEILLKPNDYMKQYLSALSQGYFSYHALGLDISCSDERLKIAQSKNWILDSSVLLPLLAIDSTDHGYALELINIIKGFKLNVKTLRSILNELFYHAKNAIKFFNSDEEYPFIDSIGKSKVSLFKQGFLNSKVHFRYKTFENYLEACLGKGYEKNLMDNIERKIKSYGIEIIDFEKLDILNEEVLAKKIYYSKEIEVKRTQNGTFVKKELCDTEAEMVVCYIYLNYQFISHSRILNNLTDINEIFTWSPEAMYRFLTLFSNVVPEENTLFQCMTQDFFYSGFEVIDSKTISLIVDPYLKQSRMSIVEEKGNYINVLGKKKYDEVLESYDNKPDYEKPIFSVQVAHYIARQEIIKSEEFQKELNKVKFDNELKESERKEYEILKARNDERHKKHKKNLARLASRRISKRYIKKKKK